MKKTLDDIRQELEVEIDTAEGLSEIMLIIHAGAHNLDRKDISFKKVSEAFLLIAQLLEEHTNCLNNVANGLVDFDNDLKIK